MSASKAFLLSNCPMATTPDGTVLLGATHVLSPLDDPHQLLDAALTTGRKVYIALEATPSEAADVRARMAEAAHEAVGVSYRERG